MEESLKDKIQSPAFLMFTLYAITAIALILFWEKGTFLLWLNEKHNPFGDFFFTYMTKFAETWVYVGIALILLAYRFYYVILLACSLVMHSLIAQFLKRVVFRFDRPGLYYKDELSNFNLVEGIRIHDHFSMPSGHSTAAFALATLLICITKNRLLQVFYMLLAILVTISRVYLFQHFLEDTIVGALIGMLCSGFMWWYFSFKNTSLLYKRKTLQKGLIFNR